MKYRVITALLAIPVVLGAVFCTNPAPFIVLAVAAFFAGSWEFLALRGLQNKGLVSVLSLFFAVLCVLWTRFPNGWVDFVVLLIALILSCASILLPLRTEAGSKEGGFVSTSELFGWVGAPLIALVLLHNARPAAWALNWKSPLLMILLPLWAGDTAGIFVGMWLGKHKLAPSISPKKTVEGAIGNLVASVAVGIGLGVYLSIDWRVALGCGLLLGVLGQLGDLFQSWIKRRAGKKDSGTLLPGHGGVLDRIDSLLFAAIPTALLLTLTAHR